MILAEECSSISESWGSLERRTWDSVTNLPSLSWGLAIIVNEQPQQQGPMVMRQKDSDPSRVTERSNHCIQPRQVRVVAAFSEKHPGWSVCVSQLRKAAMRCLRQLTGQRWKVYSAQGLERLKVQDRGAGEVVQQWRALAVHVHRHTCIHTLKIVNIQGQKALLLPFLERVQDGLAR